MRFLKSGDENNPNNPPAESTSRDRVYGRIRESVGRELPMIKSLNLGDDVYDRLEADPDALNKFTQLGIALTPEEEGGEVDFMGNKKAITGALDYLVESGLDIKDVADQINAFVTERDQLGWLASGAHRAKLGAGLMALGYNRGGTNVSNKISTLIKEGYPRKQAIAIALSMRDRSE